MKSTLATLCVVCAMSTVASAQWLKEPTRGMPASRTCRRLLLARLMESQIVERYRRTEFGRIALTQTFENPKVFSKPVTFDVKVDFVPDTFLTTVASGGGG